MKVRYIYNRRLMKAARFFEANAANKYLIKMLNNYTADMADLASSLITAIDQLNGTLTSAEHTGIKTFTDETGDLVIDVMNPNEELKGALRKNGFKEYAADVCGTITIPANTELLGEIKESFQMPGTVEEVPPVGPSGIPMINIAPEGEKPMWRRADIDPFASEVFWRPD